MKPGVESIVTNVVKQLRSVSRSQSPPVASTSATPITTSTPELVKDEILDVVPTTSTPSPKKRTRKPKEPIVYVIPDVPQLTTTFQGRLGYACLNTVLRSQTPSVFCSRTCRIKTIEEEGMAFLKELGRQNAEDLSKLIQWNFLHSIFFMRISSELFPFAAHKKYQYDLSHADKELKAAGELARRLGVRLTLHPGQYNSIGSPRPEVIENAVRDLSYQNEMLERMGMGKDSVMIIHGGGVYGDKAVTLARFKENYLKLPQAIKDRLVLENDEISYNVDDLLPLCEDLNIPLVYDYHHGWILPSKQSVAELMPRIVATFTRKGIKPKQHLSSPRRGAVTMMELRAHADRCQTLPDELPDDMDLMIEAKDKEQAVFHLYRIYNLHPVIQESLRPPAEEETTQTAGRKSNKKKKDLKGEELEGDVDMLDELDDGGEKGLKSSPAKTKSPRKSRAKVRVVEIEVEEDSEVIAREEVMEEDVKPAITSPLKKTSPMKRNANVKVESVDIITAEVVEEEEEVKPVTKSKKSPIKSRAKKVVKVKVELSEEDDDMFEESEEENDGDAYGDEDEEEIMPKKKVRKLV